MKTATPMKELIEMIKKTMGNSIDEKGFDNACSPFLAKEKQDIINAHQCGVLDGYKLAVDGDESSEVDSADYFTQKYKQQ